MEFPTLLERFIRYCRIDTTADEGSTTFPSTAKQLDLSRLLVQELLCLGLSDACLTEHGYVLATLPSNRPGSNLPAIAYIAHVDTAQDVSGTDVKPRVHSAYKGGDLELSPGGPVLRELENLPMPEKRGMTLITADGSTLLGADDKAGIAEIMAAVEYLIAHPEIARPDLRIVFTPDEEIGRGADKITVTEIKAKYGYTIDGGRAGDLEIDTFCADTVEVKIKGINVHPGTSKGKMLNALKVSSYFIDQFPHDSLSPETTELREGYVHPYIIKGNAELCVLRILVRDFEERGLAEKENLIQGLVDRTQAKFPKATIEMQVIPSYRNLRIVLDKHPEVITKAEDAIRATGLVPRRHYLRGGTDGARLSFMGLPCPNLYSGVNNAHSIYEWIALEDMVKESETLVNLARLWAE